MPSEASTSPSTPHRARPTVGGSIMDAVEDLFDIVSAEADLRGAARSREDAIAGGQASQTGSVASGLVDGPSTSKLASEAATPEAPIGTVGPVAEARLVQLMLSDPEPATRAEAAESLAASGAQVGTEIIQRGLADPDDRVRAETVRLAARVARGGSPDAPSITRWLIPLLWARQWPTAQRTVLSVLPSVLSAAPEPGGNLGPSDLGELLEGIGRLDPPPLPFELPGLEGVARAIGRDRLTGGLQGLDEQRLGAARLLLADGSPAALETVARLAEDPNQGIRRLAASAEELGEDDDTRSAGSGTEPYAESRFPSEEQVREDLLSSLARALHDPDDSVRAEAVASLERLPDDMLLEWTGRALSEGVEPRASRAATLVEHMAPRDAFRALAPLVLQRAGSAPFEQRGPYLRAIAGLRLGPEELVAAAASTDPGHRQDAVRVAWQLGGRAVLPSLSLLLEDSAGPVRMAALEVLGESGDPSALQVASRLLAEDSSAAVRAAAVHVLARSNLPGRRSALVTACSDPDPDVRATALEALPAGDLSGIGDVLLGALADPDDRVWQAALRRLASAGERDSPLQWAAIRDSSPERRQQLLRAIERNDPGRLTHLALANAHAVNEDDRNLAIDVAARAGSTEATGLVLAGLRDPHARVRRTAAAAMSTLRTPLAVESLADALSDPQADVRLEAIRALGVIDDDDVPGVLISALKDPEVRVRDTAADALTRWRSPAVARRLASALASPDLRRPAGSVLQRLGSAALGPLVDVVTGPDQAAAAAAAGLLEQMAGAEAFIAGLSSTDPQQRLRSVEVLGAIGGPSAAQALTGALSDPDVRVRLRVATLLGKVGDSPAVRALRRTFLSDPVAEVSQAAEESLRSLGAGAGATDVAEAGRIVDISETEDGDPFRQPFPEE